MARPVLPKPEAVLPSIAAIIESGQLTKGENLRLFEEEAASYLGVDQCVAVSSCTSGLMLCLQAVARKLGAGDSRKVALPGFTFLAGATAVSWAGLEPLFVEVNSETMNICPSHLEKVLDKEKPAAVMGVHCFGNPASIQELEHLCSSREIPLLFDAAHAFGSSTQGEKIGGQAWCQVFSLTPTKMVVAGEGGVVATNDTTLARDLRVGREYGNDGNYDTVFPGLNARMSEFHAILARESLRLLDQVVKQRNEVACRLLGALSEVPGLTFQTIAESGHTTYKDFTLVIDEKEFGLDRDRVADLLLEEGIPTRKYFSPPCHKHQAFRHLEKRELPITEKLSKECLSIPLLSLDTVSGIADTFKKLHHHAEELRRL